MNWILLVLAICLAWFAIAIVVGLIAAQVMRRVGEQYDEWEGYDD